MAQNRGSNWSVSHFLKGGRTIDEQNIESGGLGCLHSLKLTFSHLKMDGWKMNFLLGQKAYFQVQAVSFREGNPSFCPKTLIFPKHKLRRNKKKAAFEDVKPSIFQPGEAFQISFLNGKLNGPSGLPHGNLRVPPPKATPPKK